LAWVFHTHLLLPFSVCEILINKVDNHECIESENDLEPNLELAAPIEMSIQAFEETNVKQGKRG
jgi:hypothetical protein